MQFCQAKPQSVPSSSVIPKAHENLRRCRAYDPPNSSKLMQVYFSSALFLLGALNYLFFSFSTDMIDFYF